MRSTGRARYIHLGRFWTFVVVTPFLAPILYVSRQLWKQPLFLLYRLPFPIPYIFNVNVNGASARLVDDVFDVNVVATMGAPHRRFACYVDLARGGKLGTIERESKSVNRKGES